MSSFTPEQAAALAATTVRAAILIEFMFDDGGSPAAPAPIRLWNGNGLLRTLDGSPAREWQGVGEFGSVDGLKETRDAESQSVTFSLSGVSADVAAAAVGEQEGVQGKLVTTYLQLFDDDWQLVGMPFGLSIDVCQTMTINRSEAQGEAGASRMVSIVAENLFSGRSRPAAGRYTDRDQKIRFAGDRFFEFTPQLANLIYVWPNF